MDFFRSSEHSRNSMDTTAPPHGYVVPVTLTATHPPFDRRQLFLSPTQPTPIGRASKSETKNLQASPANALFDSPVVSRHHAELKAHPWAARDGQVTIVDQGSMHGTRVNGIILERGRPMSLRSGDLVQFGEKVTRGSDTHEGVLVTFDRPQSYSQSSHTLAANTQDSRTKRGYHYPSSDEESDAPSEDGISVISYEDGELQHEESATKTTPEHTKSKLGSQEEPIVVESDAAAATHRPAVISLDDDEEYVPPPPPSLFARPLGQYFKPPQTVEVVQDSVDQSGDVLAPGSVRWPAPKPMTMHDLVESEHSDDESVFEHNTVLTDILNDGRHERGLASEHGEEDAESSDDENSDKVDYPDGSDVEEESEDEADGNDSDDASSNADKDSEVSEASDDNVSDLIESAFNKPSQPSPELGSDDAAPSQDGPFNLNTVTPAAPPKPRYDPVRGSQPPLKSRFTPENNAGPFKTPSTYTYAPSAYSKSVMPMNMTPGTDFYGNSSRWDMPPASSTYPAFKRPVNDYAHGGSVFDNVYSSSIQAGSPPPFGLESMDERASNPAARVPRIDPLQPFAFDHGWTDVPPAPGFPLNSCMPVKPPFGAPPMPLKSPAPANKNTSSTNKKISITDIVEDEDIDTSAGAGSNILNTFTQETQPASAPKTDLKFGVLKSAEKTKSGSKRKADEIATETPAGLPSTRSDSEHAKEFWVTMTSPSQPNVQDPAQESQEPPARRRRVNAQALRRSGGVAEITILAAATALGGVGTMAFLCSPLAERVLQWLA